jgi:hypothetical protein
MKLEEIQIGKEYIWKHSLPGGYGYTQHIIGLALIKGNKKIKIIVYKLNGETKEIWVNPERLIEKNDSKKYYNKF